jgi:hypothetical protein
MGTLASYHQEQACPRVWEKKISILQLLWRIKAPVISFSSGRYVIGVQVDYNVVHLRTSLVQLFVLLLQIFEKVVQIIELKRFGGAPNGYPFAPLDMCPLESRGRTSGGPRILTLGIQNCTWCEFFLFWQPKVHINIFM